MGLKKYFEKNKKGGDKGGTKKINEEQTLKEDEKDTGNKLPKGNKRRGKLKKRSGCNQRRAARLLLTSAGGDASGEEGSL